MRISESGAPPSGSSLPLGDRRYTTAKSWQCWSRFDVTDATNSRVDPFATVTLATTLQRLLWRKPT